MYRVICIKLLMLLCIIICLVLYIAINTDEHIVMSNVKTGDQPRSGRLVIPSEDVKMDLYQVHDVQLCSCYYGLYNGGKIEVRGVDLSTVGIDCMADIRQEDVHLVLECVEILDCVKIGKALVSLHGVVNADGDVLIVMCDNSPLVKVWRMTVL